jgi:hypothetical protein
MFWMPNSLNSRDSLREKASGGGPGDPTFLQLSPIPQSSLTSRRPKSLSVHIQTVSKTDYGYPTPGHSPSLDVVSVLFFGSSRLETDTQVPTGKVEPVGQRTPALLRLRIVFYARRRCATYPFLDVAIAVEK